MVLMVVEAEVPNQNLGVESGETYKNHVKPDFQLFKVIFPTNQPCLPKYYWLLTFSSKSSA